MTAELSGVNNDWTGQRTFNYIFISALRVGLRNHVKSAPKFHTRDLFKQQQKELKFV